MRHRWLLSVSLAALLSGGAARAQTFDFNVPSDDRWHYPFNPVPGTRSVGSCFGSVGFLEFQLNNRDGIVVLAWDTSTAITPGLGPENYPVASVRVTTTNLPNAEWPVDTTADDWFTYDLSGDQIINADGIPRGEPGDTDGESDDPDPGRPIELFGAGFGPVFTLATWTEFSFYVGGDADFNTPRDPFPFVFRDGTGELLHVEDSVFGFHNEGLTPPFCGPPDTACPFTPTPWAAGVPINYTPGAQPTAFDVTFDIDLSLSDGRVREYFQQQLDAGRVVLVLTSLRETTIMAGQEGFPSFFMKESTDPQAIPARLRIVLAPCAVGDGDINCDGAVDLMDRDLFVGVLLGVETDPDFIDRSDLDGSGSPDGLDVQRMIDALMAGP